MQLRLVVILALFVILGGAIFYFTQPAAPDSSSETTPPPARTAAPADAVDERRIDAEPVAVQAVTEDAADQGDGEVFRVFGRVLDATSREPLPGATISVQNPGDDLPELVTADDSGAFEIPVRANQGRLAARADGYAMSRVLLPSPLESAYQLDISLRRGASVTGYVVEKGTNEPVEGIVVRAVPAGGTIASFSVDVRGSSQYSEDTTGDDGQFLLTELEAGAYRVVVEGRKAGYLFTSDMAEVLSLDEGDAAEGVRFELERGAIVVGTVRGPGGNPVHAARVRAVPTDAISAVLRGLETQDTEVFAEIVDDSDAEGRFELPGLAYEAGYRLMAIAPGYAAGYSDEFVIPRRQRSASVDMQLTIGSTITGSVELEDGSPVPDKRLVLMPTGEAMAHMNFGPHAMRNNIVSSDDDGRFSLANIPAGSYVLNLTDRSHRLLEPFSITVDGASLYDGITLVAEESGRPSFGEGAITGLVLDTGGRPAPGVTVSARPAFIARGVASTVTEPDGRFVLETPPGRRFDVLARTEYGRAMMESVQVGADIVLELRPPARVSGIVIDARNRPVPDAEVRLERAAGRVPEDPAEEVLVAVGGMMGPGDGAQRSEVNGHFTFPEVDPGEYTVQAKSQALGAGESFKFVVHDGQDIGNVEVRLEPGVTFSGRVQDGSGQPVSGAFVRLTPVGPGGEMQQMMANFMPMGAGQDAASSASQRDGRFELSNVNPGEYTLEATHARFAKTIQRGITISRGADVRGHLVVMTQGGTARGRYAPGGQPQAGAMILVLGESGMQMATTAFDGTFQMDNLTSGEYMLFPMRFDATDPADFLDLLNSAQVVDIGDGDLADIDFSPPAGGQPVTGTVNTGADSITVISLRRPGGPDPATINPMNMLQAMRALRYQVAVGTANPDGSFNLNAVPPGEYILDAVTLDASVMTNPDPSLLFNLDQFPRITQNVTVGSGPLNLDLQF